ncbi:hypothetical protein SAMN04489867_1102 [Pedococcus dokdonensis]|uniref:Uncharacterized protein n=1 Tax=Pedococcus dokdonensis TaxID=443156 RepID=A0A1H0P0W3_9MICO|nr:hypothetical protein [Pedococcus dokdonensis]SDO98553.1 hypothetical protein SAMN04489867_1102 [Pedococcus dokdonensis]
MTPDGPLIELVPEPNLTEGYAGREVTGDALGDSYADDYLRLTYGWGVYLNVTGAEAKAVASALLGSGGLGYVYTCTALGKVPGYAGTVARMICSLVGVPSAKSILNAIASLWRDGASTSTCYQKRILPSVAGWRAVAMRNCTG